MTHNLRDNAELRAKLLDIVANTAYAEMACDRILDAVQAALAHAAEEVDGRLSFPECPACGGPDLRTYPAEAAPEQPRPFVECCFCDTPTTCEARGCAQKAMSLANCVKAAPASVPTPAKCACKDQPQDDCQCGPCGCALRNALRSKSPPTGHPRAGTTPTPEREPATCPECHWRDCICGPGSRP